MAADMDIDMDLDLGPLPEEEQIFEEPTPAPVSTVVQTDPEIPLAYTDQTLDIQPNKVHIRGLDEATTDQIRDFAKEHFTLAEPTRIEWIDDTSANILYSTKELATKALDAFTLDPSNPAITNDPLEVRTAKSMPARPESMLQVRAALFSDKKKPRAHEASRFYLMHPEHDPRERMKIERERGGRAGGEHGDYKRRRFDDREHRRRRDRNAGGDPTANFDASMYDDEKPSNGDGARGRDLFTDTKGSRNRSASPDGIRSASQDDTRSRFRSRRSPPPRKRDVNASKELFPTSKSTNGTGSTSLLQRERDAPPARELFPESAAANKKVARNIKRELFPHKTDRSNHRRTDAFDAAADAAAEDFDRKMKVPFTDGSRELFPDTVSDGGINIRGGAGLSIKGGAGISVKGRGAKEIKELFPASYDESRKKNEGKELFSDVLEGRGGRRRRAEDLFG